MFTWKCANFSFLKTSFAEYRILEWQFFLCRTSTMSSHCHLASMVSDKKSAVNLIEIPSYVKSHFALAAFRILCLSIVWLWYSRFFPFFFFFYSLSYLKFMKLFGLVDLLFFVNQIGGVFIIQIFFLMLFLLCFRDSRFEYTTMLDSVPEVSKALFISLFIFLFLSIDSVNWFIFKLMDSFFCLLRSVAEPL